MRQIAVGDFRRSYQAIIDLQSARRSSLSVGDVADAALTLRECSRQGTALHPVSRPVRLAERIGSPGF